MDPNANLIEQECIIDALNDYVVPQMQAQEKTRKARLRELRHALREWLKNGGFEPDWNIAPHARKYFGR